MSDERTFSSFGQFHASSATAPCVTDECGWAMQGRTADAYIIEPDVPGPYWWAQVYGRGEFSWEYETDLCATKEECLAEIESLCRTKRFAMTLFVEKAG